MNDLMSRQSNIIHPRTQSLTAIVVGAGMGGSWVSLALSKMIHKVVVYDFDRVEAVNIGSAAYNFLQVKEYKTDALSILSGGLLEGFSRRFPLTISKDFFTLADCVMVSCVDT